MHCCFCTFTILPFTMARVICFNTFVITASPARRSCHHFRSVYSSSSLLTFCLAKLESNGDRYWALTLLFQSSQLSALIWEIPTQTLTSPLLVGVLRHSAASAGTLGPAVILKADPFPARMPVLLPAAVRRELAQQEPWLARAPLTRSPERPRVTCSSSLVYMETENPVAPDRTTQIIPPDLSRIYSHFSLQTQTICTRGGWFIEIFWISIIMGNRIFLQCGDTKWTLKTITG